jgi:hypothetical protein
MHFIRRSLPVLGVWMSYPSALRDRAGILLWSGTIKEGSNAHRI